MKITRFDRPALKLIATEMQTALKSVEDKFGIKFTYKGGKHTWGTDGQHSNSFCKKCFVSEPKQT